MSLNRCCLRDERAAIWVAAILGAISGALCFFFWVFSGPSENKIPAAEVWAFIAEEAPKKGLDPGFVYSLAWAESSLDVGQRPDGQRHHAAKLRGRGPKSVICRIGVLGIEDESPISMII